MTVKFKFDSKKFECDMKKAIEKDIKKNPNQILNNHIGESLNSPCPKCNSNTLKIIKGGKAKCNSCNAIISLDFDIKWK